jgi:hypothetical protein
MGCLVIDQCLVMGKLTRAKEKSKCAGLAQENGFAPAYLLSLLRLVKGAAKLSTC